MKANPNESSNKPIVIIGGTGKTGRRVAERLGALGIAVRIGSRSGNPPFDWTDRSTWAAALEGTRAAYVTYYPDLAVPGASDDIAEFSKLALENGVRRIVLLSGRGEEGAQVAEQALRDSGAAWTIVRASWFNQNFDESFLADAVRSGIIALPTANVPEPFLDADDIADVAAAALTDDRHIGQEYELTGPRALTFEEVADIISQEIGRDVRFVSITLEEFTAGLRQEGLPEDFVELLVYLFTSVLDGRNTGITDGVRRALGREPLDFKDYARKAAATGVWSAVESHG